LWLSQSIPLQPLPVEAPVLNPKRISLTDIRRNCVAAVDEPIGKTMKPFSTEDDIAKVEQMPCGPEKDAAIFNLHNTRPKTNSEQSMDAAREVSIKQLAVWMTADVPDGCQMLLECCQMLLECCQMLLECCQMLLECCRCCWNAARCCWNVADVAGMLSDVAGMLPDVAGMLPDVAGMLQMLLDGCQMLLECCKCCW
jgi:hypothetical protein